jgi:hypothetical protein
MFFYFFIKCHKRGSVNKSDSQLRKKQITNVVMMSCQQEGSEIVNVIIAMSIRVKSIISYLL